MHVRVFLSRYRMQADCPTCSGTRVRPDALAYRIKNKTIAEIWNTPLGELGAWFQELHRELVAAKTLPRQLKDVFENICSRIQHLNDLGLSYLTLDRQARTLSGGETQRVNLAAALGSNLVSTHFVLDEPSVGLHSRDTERLISSLQTLYTRGNSLLVVEHDTDCLEASNITVELGPKAGEEGGEVV